jgi:hypothetical protein
MRPERYRLQWRLIDYDIACAAGLPWWTKAAQLPAPLPGQLRLRPWGMVWVYGFSLVMPMQVQLQGEAEAKMLDFYTAPPKMAVRMPLRGPHAFRIATAMCAQSRRWCCTPDAPVVPITKLSEVTSDYYPPWVRGAQVQARWFMAHLRLLRERRV